MGGANAGEVASALVIESLHRAMVEHIEGDSPDAWEDALKSSVEHANRAVWRAAREPGRRGMGATLTAVCVHGSEAVIAEVGDSRGYLIRAHRIRQITRDQSFVQVLVDSGALKPEEAAKNPMKNVVLQAMGQTQQIAVAIGRLDLRRGDRLLLCSDGLSNKLSDEEICRHASEPLTLDESAPTLIRLANEHGGEDNITVVLAEIGGDGVAEHRPVETVTQTLHVVSEYKGAGRRVEEPLVEDEDAPESGRAPPAAPEPTPATHLASSEPPEIELRALHTDPAPRATDPVAHPRRAANSLYSSLIAVAIGVGLALLVVWLFLGY
jgi:serine/threonine protein phosphatase PrpC